MKSILKILKKRIKGRLNKNIQGHNGPYGYYEVIRVDRMRYIIDSEIKKVIKSLSNHSISINEGDELIKKYKGK